MRISFLLVTVAFFVLSGPVAGWAEDQEGCLLCHGLEGLGALEAGSYRSLTVDPRSFSGSKHGRETCRGCHRDIVSVPHESVGQVNCGLDCHVADKTTGKLFSHESLYWNFVASIHGKDSKNPASCRTCHRRDTAVRGGKESIVDRTVACTSCHLDRDLMSKFGLTTGKTERFFRDVHGKVIMSGGRRAPTCPDCHTQHAVLPSSRDNSSTHASHLAATCSGTGVPEEQRSCHREATTARLVGMSPLEAATWRQEPGGMLLYLVGVGLALLLTVRSFAVLVRTR